MSLCTHKNIPLSVKPTCVIVLSWIILTFLLFCFVMSITAGQGEVSPIFLVFVGLGVFILLATGPLEMDMQAITYRSPLGRYQIRWDEVSHIEIDGEGQAIVFCGSGKRLAALGPMYWAGADREQMQWLMTAQMEAYQIEGRLTPQALFRWSKKTKIRSKANQTTIQRANK